MSIQFHLIFGVLVSEMALLTIFMLPLPRSWRKAMLRSFAAALNSQTVRIAAAIIMTLVTIAFLDAMVRIRQQRAELAGAHEALNMPNAQAEPYIKAKIFYAERNAYLTGITLFLSLILYRFQVVVSDLVRAEDLQSAMTKQLEGRQREYERVLKENEELKASGEEARKLKLNNEALVKQAEGLQKEYDRVAALLQAAEQRSRSDGGDGAAAKKDD